MEAVPPAGPSAGTEAAAPAGLSADAAAITPVRSAADAVAGEPVQSSAAPETAGTDPEVPAAPAPTRTAARPGS
jgi:hypothetical protein